ncbi:MAG: hypothetical protein K8R41_04235 [Bacteroidales bacterium]|nr:hypothetical protein [Bacteroidales bacterium]
MKKISILILVLSVFIAFNVNAQKTGSFTDNRNDKTYKTVEIGDQIWMAENLKFWVEKDSPYYKGVSHFYKGVNEYYHRYGRLYPWNVAIKVCPKGWHLPSMDEWFSLINSFGDLYNANGKIPTKKESSKAKVKERRLLFKEIYAALKEGESSGFDVLYAGYRDPDAYQGVRLSQMPGYYYNLGTTASFWSSDDNVEKGMFKKMKAKGFQFQKWGKTFYPIPIRKRVGCSVRCVKDK